MPLYIHAPQNAHHAHENGHALCPVCEALGFTLGALGLGSITPSNAPEISARMWAWECINGATLRDANGARPISAEDVVQHIGLRTNWGDTRKSRAAFLRGVIGGEMDRAMHRFVTTRDGARDVSGTPLPRGARVTDHATLTHTGTVTGKGETIRYRPTTATPHDPTTRIPTVTVVWDGKEDDAPMTVAGDTLRLIGFTDTPDPHGIALGSARAGAAIDAASDELARMDLGIA